MRRAIFVAAAARSGSTMLDLMLGSHPDADSCGEIGSWYEPARGVRHGPDCSCGHEPCSAWSFLDHTPKRRFHQGFLDARGVSTAVDSSKRLSWILRADRWCRQAGIEPGHVLLWKGPKALAHSYWKRSGDIDQWRPRFHRYYEPYLDSGLAAAVVSYDDLVARPAPVLARVSDLLGLPVTESQHQFWTVDGHYAFGSAGTLAQRQAGESELRAPTFDDDFERAWAASAGIDRRTGHLVERLSELSAGEGWLDAGPRRTRVRLRARLQAGRLRARQIRRLDPRTRTAAPRTAAPRTTTPRTAATPNLTGPSRSW